MANEKRLIDANALLEKFQFRLPISDHIAESIDECVKMARRIIKDAPTVDAVEVVHGRWQERRFICMDSEVMLGYRCSECNLTFDVETNYCPNCGAKMDGDGNA